MQTIYHMFTEHGVMPSVLYNAPLGERILCNAIFQVEMESRMNSNKIGQ